MKPIGIIGIGLATCSVQLHGASADGSVVCRRKRVPDTVFGLSGVAAAVPGGDGGLLRARTIGADRFGKLGHEVKRRPPIDVKPFVQREKNDAVDAEVICEAASRPMMRFVVVKAEDQQTRGMRFRTRDLRVRQRTQTLNAPPGPSGGVRCHRCAGFPRMSAGGRWPSRTSPRRCRNRSVKGARFCSTQSLGCDDQGLGKGAPHPRTPGRGGGPRDDHFGGWGDQHDGDRGRRAANGALSPRA